VSGALRPGDYELLEQEGLCLICSFNQFIFVQCKKGEMDCRDAYGD